MMSRIFMGLDETNPMKPVPCIYIQGVEKPLMLSERELHTLVEEIQWILGHISGKRSAEWLNLANKYKEVQNA